MYFQERQAYPSLLLAYPFPRLASNSWPSSCLGPLKGWNCQNELLHLLPLIFSLPCICNHHHPLCLLLLFPHCSVGAPLCYWFQNGKKRSSLKAKLLPAALCRAHLPHKVYPCLSATSFKIYLEIIKVLHASRGP